MSRLIDADALCTHIENEFDGVCVYDVSGNEAAREFCDMVDIAPTIDAIPVEWLEQQFYDNPKSQWAEKCRDVYTKWQKWQRWQEEQEAQDG